MHSKFVIVVRLCALGVKFASAGDDALIMLWREKAARQAFGEAAPAAGATAWGPVCALRGHCEDVYDLCWAPRAESLFSGGVDGSTIVWNIGKAKPAQIVREHEHYVQGVAWDPQDQYLVSVSLDRTARLYSASKGVKLVSKPDDPRDFTCHTVLSKRTHSLTGGADATSSAAAASSSEGAKGGAGAKVNLFLDDSVSSFYRRPTWSPDGSFLLLPCGQYYSPDQPPPLGAPKPTTFVFARGNLATPCAHLPSPDKAVIAIRCCPTLYEKRKPPAAAAAASEERQQGWTSEGGGSAAEEGGEWMAGLPYRVLWAVATLSSIAVYDSSTTVPLLVASNTHYEPLTDIAWLPDGSGLIASSIDGYCTLLRFRPGILGTPLPQSNLPACMRPEPPKPPANVAVTSGAGAQTLISSGFASASSSAGGSVQVLQVRHKPKEATAPAAAAAPPPAADASSSAAQPTAAPASAPEKRRLMPVAISSTDGNTPPPAVRRVAPIPLSAGATAAAAEPAKAAAPAAAPRRIAPVPIAADAAEASTAAPAESEAPAVRRRAALRRCRCRESAGDGLGWHLRDWRRPVVRASACAKRL